MARAALFLLLLPALAGAVPSPAHDAPAAAARHDGTLLPPSFPDDPADSLYRAARALLTQGRYRDALRDFRLLRERYPRSAYVGDAYYWEAFARYRLGGAGNLRGALAALERQQRDYPRASTRGDADALATRVRAELARSGDVAASEEIYAAAMGAAAAGAAVAAVGPEIAAAMEELRGTAAAAPRAPRPPRPPRAPLPPGMPGDDGRCRDDEDDVRTAALNGLLQMDAERALPVLKKVLARRDEGSACLRRRAVFLLSQQRSPEVSRILLDLVRNDPDPEVREQAVFWLSQVPTEEAVTALDSIVRTSKDPEVVEKALFALSQQESPRAVAALRAVAERADADPDAREKAIFWLGQRGGTDGVAYLRQLYPRLQDPELREKVLATVAQARDPQVLPFLVGVAKDPKEPMEVRRRAIFWAGQAGASVADLWSFYQSVGDAEVKESVIFALSQAKGDDATDRLIDVARKEPNRELRKKAIFWLGQRGDAKAAQALEQLLVQP